VVCRTNGQVLRLAGLLHDKNIPFQIARDKNEFSSSRMACTVFLGWKDPRSVFKILWRKHNSTLAISENHARELWNGMVSSFGPPKAVSFNIIDLRASITDGIVIPEYPLYERNTNVIPLSTIHRSKGREFANVIVVMSSKSADSKS